MKSFIVGKAIATAMLFTTSLSAAESKLDCKETYGTGNSIITLATGSPGELGLLETLANEFNKANDITLCWVKAGSGKSLKLLKDKQADIVLVHAPTVEKKAVEEGWAIKRTLIGANEFYIVGSKNDPAGIANAGSVAEAYTKIAKAKAPFISRGDNSGTNKKELAIWQSANITPQGDWYVITNDFMLASLQKANEINGYFMTDSSTWVAGKKGLDNIDVLYRGDPVLINTYHGLVQPEGATTNQAEAAKLMDFIASDKGQQIIRDYGKAQYGEAMYNDAEYAKQFEK